MYLADHARLTPDKPAVIMAESGAVMTYAELNDRSNRLAQYLYAQGLRRGDHIAIFMENNIRFMEVCWGGVALGALFHDGQPLPAGGRGGLYRPGLRGQGAGLVPGRAETAGQMTDLIPDCPKRLMVDGVIPGWESYEDAIAAYPAEPLAEEFLGESMLYSSGTTGRPKGVLKPLPQMGPAEGGRLRRTRLERYKVSPDMVYLSPAPLYHAAPNAYVLSTQFVGGTVVVMERFDAMPPCA